VVQEQGEENEEIHEEENDKKPVEYPEFNPYITDPVFD